MEENRTHTRVPLSEISETPNHGTYVTDGELAKYGIFAGAVLLALSLFALFRKRSA
ncbi:MAG: hypothetical protein Q4C06_04155 [Bacillota bacterium]|nr:hypothetical protein [Bacillota bacterium]